MQFLQMWYIDQILQSLTSDTPHRMTIHHGKFHVHFSLQVLGNWWQHFALKEQAMNIVRTSLLLHILMLMYLFSSTVQGCFPDHPSPGMVEGSPLQQAQFVGSLSG